jgi:hypothetical protein
MLALRQLAALMITTIARWLAPLHGPSSERWAESFFWLLVTFNLLAFVIWFSPDTLRDNIGTEHRGRNLLIGVAVWTVLHALFFGRRSITQLATQAQMRWPVLVGREHWLVGAYFVLTGIAFWGQLWLA